MDLLTQKGNSSLLSLCSFSKELQEHAEVVGGRKGLRRGNQVLCREGRDALSFALVLPPSLHLHRIVSKINRVSDTSEFHHLSTVQIPGIIGKTERNRLEKIKIYV